MNLELLLNLLPQLWCPSSSAEKPDLVLYEISYSIKSTGLG